MSQPPRDKLLDLTVVSLPRPDEALAPELARSRLKLQSRYHHLLVDEASIQDLAIRGGLEPGLCAWVCLRMAER